MVVPVVDVAPLVEGVGDRRAVGRQIDAACRDLGFFAIAGHGVDATLRARLERAARAFFDQDESTKAEIAMRRAGRAWRGWFPVGGELTSGVADQKEGIYFGAELADDDPRVLAGLPLHGPNLFPDQPTELRPTVLEYIDVLTALGQVVLEGMALGLGLDEHWFRRELTADPTILFRVFGYPPPGDDRPPDGWGVAEHTDYGLLTILGQDDTGGLEVRSPTEWIEVDADPELFVCNIGDMLERMTGGQYRSTPHRVRNTTSRYRCSFPFFLDPSWDVRVRPVPGLGPGDASDNARWDGESVHAFEGTYGEYLVAKVAKVFPALRGEIDC